MQPTLIDAYLILKKYMAEEDAKMIALLLDGKRTAGREVDWNAIRQLAIALMASMAFIVGMALK